VSIKVVVVDDQELVRAGFAALLGAQPDIEVVATAADGAEGVATVRRLSPHVVLMDVRMPVLDGIEATRQILRGAAQVPRVIMLTTFDADDYIYESLRAGASGFLLKDASPTELAEAVRVVAAGDALLSPSVTRRVIEQYAAASKRRRPKDLRLAKLTDREREVLVLVATGRSNQEIADQLVLAEQTVKTHVSRIFGKLDLRDRAQAVVLAYETGLVVPGCD
jgi:DNA-binding NarL/FixJ family response regulator